MSAEQDDFEQLRRLLALKKFEQPPPGYFQYFSREVIARIRTGESCPVGSWELLLSRFPWLQRLRSALELRPAVAGTFGAMVCGFLIIAGVYTDSADETSGQGALLAGSGLLLAPATLPMERSVALPTILPVQASFPSMGGVRGVPSQPLPGTPQFQPLNYTVPTP